jgi:ABC-type branched-subunit amino acid transport system ATPase component
VNTPLLGLESVCKQFGGLQAVRDVDLALNQGQILGLIGPNGAGKTTLLNMISGTMLPSRGQIRYFGLPITRYSPQRRCRLGIMRTFQNLSLLQGLSNLDNVLLGANAWQTCGLWDLFAWGQKREAALGLEAQSNLEAVGLGQQAADLPGELSYGNQRKLEIARALMGRPQLLLLDEPAAGLNNKESQGLADLLLGLRDDRGLSLILIEHDMDVLMHVSDQVVVLVEGGILTTGPPRQVQQDPQVIEAYLGQEDIFDDLAD